ncbi:hypothetical protein BB560_001548 [Smittium megazygosporum]|uniref:RING-type domain-containing protein n=1 Tax=Smittium megazygosporum TaxID=133381 RepID=A0A2T9ZHC1_9FUNG|nr:hypothetical protein BB560_001548 [Smittium megazygosporum]
MPADLPSKNETKLDHNSHECSEIPNHTVEGTQSKKLLPADMPQEPKDKDLVTEKQEETYVESGFGSNFNLDSSSNSNPIAPIEQITGTTVGNLTESNKAVNSPNPLTSSFTEDRLLVSVSKSKGSTSISKPKNITERKDPEKILESNFDAAGSPDSNLDLQASFVQNERSANSTAKSTSSRFFAGNNLAPNKKVRVDRVSNKNDPKKPPIAHTLNRKDDLNLQKKGASFQTIKQNKKPSLNPSSDDFVDEGEKPGEKNYIPKASESSFKNSNSSYIILSQDSNVCNKLTETTEISILDEPKQIYKSKIGPENPGKKHNENSQDTIPGCPICFEPFSTSNHRRAICIPCGHAFCRQCLYKWFGIKDTINKTLYSLKIKIPRKPCPECNKLSSYKDFRTIYPSCLVAVDESKIESISQKLSDANLVINSNKLEILNLKSELRLAVLEKQYLRKYTQDLNNKITDLQSQLDLLNKTDSFENKSTSEQYPSDTAHLNGSHSNVLSSDHLLPSLSKNDNDNSTDGTKSSKKIKPSDGNLLNPVDSTDILPSSQFRSVQPSKIRTSEDSPTSSQLNSLIENCLKDIDKSQSFKVLDNYSSKDNKFSVDSSNHSDISKNDIIYKEYTLGQDISDSQFVTTKHPSRDIFYVCKSKSESNLSRISCLFSRSCGSDCIANGSQFDDQHYEKRFPMSCSSPLIESSALTLKSHKRPIKIISKSMIKIQRDQSDIIEILYICVASADCLTILKSAITIDTRLIHTQSISSSFELVYQTLLKTSIWSIEPDLQKQTKFYFGMSGCQVIELEVPDFREFQLSEPLYLLDQNRKSGPINLSSRQNHKKQNATKIEGVQSQYTTKFDLGQSTKYLLGKDNAIKLKLGFSPIHSIAYTKFYSTKEAQVSDPETLENPNIIFKNNPRVLNDKDKSAEIYDSMNEEKNSFLKDELLICANFEYVFSIMLNPNRVMKKKASSSKTDLNFSQSINENISVENESLSGSKFDYSEIKNIRYLLDENPKLRSSQILETRFPVDLLVHVPQGLQIHTMSFDPISQNVLLVCKCKLECVDNLISKDYIDQFQPFINSNYQKQIYRPSDEAREKIRKTLSDFGNSNHEIQGTGLYEREKAFLLNKYKSRCVGGCFIKLLYKLSYVGSRPVALFKGKYHEKVEERENNQIPNPFNPADYVGCFPNASSSSDKNSDSIAKFRASTLTRNDFILSFGIFDSLRKENCLGISSLNTKTIGVKNGLVFNSNDIAKGNCNSDKKTSIDKNKEPKKGYDYDEKSKKPIFLSKRSDFSVSTEKFSNSNVNNDSSVFENGLEDNVSRFGNRSEVYIGYKDSISYSNRVVSAISSSHSNKLKVIIQSLRSKTEGFNVNNGLNQKGETTPSLELLDTFIKDSGIYEFDFKINREIPLASKFIKIEVEKREEFERKSKSVSSIFDSKNAGKDESAFFRKNLQETCDTEISDLDCYSNNAFNSEIFNKNGKSQNYYDLRYKEMGGIWIYLNDRIYYMGI